MKMTSGEEFLEKSIFSSESLHTKQLNNFYLLSLGIIVIGTFIIYHFKVDLLVAMCDVDKICSLVTNLYNYTLEMGSSRAKVNTWIYFKQIYALCAILVHCIHCNILKVYNFPKGFQPKVGRSFFYIPRHCFCLSTIRYSHDMITCPFILVKVHIIYIVVLHLK